MSHVRLLIIALLATQSIAGAVIAGARTSARHESPAGGGTKSSGQHAIKDSRSSAATPLDRVTSAVDGAESSHGKDIGMWRPDPSGPQGPMQVSEAAASDVGGGDRFDASQNRALGRAYLAQLYWRYKNWPDAIAAYNWGVGKVDAWVKAGRPADKLLIGVAVYLSRVLHESGFCDGPEATQIRPPSARTRAVGWSSPEFSKAAEGLSTDTLVHSACSTPDAWGGLPGINAASSSFSKKLDQAMQLARQHAATSQHLALAPQDRLAAPWSMMVRRP